VPVRDAVERAVEAVGERHKGGLSIPVDLEIPDGLAVQADPERFKQVMRALIDNAVKFSEGNGRITISAISGPDPGRVRIAVADQGIGIPADDVPRIFDRFYQVDNSATRRHGGTGMGLALVRRFVGAHHATIDVESAPGSGTRMVLDWPAVPVEPGAPAADAPAKKDGRTRRGSKSGGQVPVRP